MKLQEIASRLELEVLTPFFDKEVKGVYISDNLSEVIANAQQGHLLVTGQVHNNALAAANLVEISAILVAQGKRPTEDVLKMAVKTQIPVLMTPLNRWQVATKLYEAGVR